MLIVFNLALERLDIDKQVSNANARMANLVSQLGLGNTLYYNLASMGAGELRISFPWQNNEDIPERTFSFLRRMHWRAKRGFLKDHNARLSFETREMLLNLKKKHTLVAVWTGSSHEAQERLKQTRFLDFFGDNVVDYGDAPENYGDKTSVGLYREAFRRMRTSPCDTIIVSDTPQGVEEARIVKPLAVVGYVASSQELDEKGHQYRALEQAGADHIVIGGASVCALPDYIYGKRQLSSTLALVNRRFE